MTRFARARGSKGSNERAPEQATSWAELKSQFLGDGTGNSFAKSEDEIGFNQFSNENNNEVKTVWEDLNSFNKDKKVNGKKGILSKKKLKNVDMKKLKDKKQFEGKAITCMKNAVEPSKSLQGTLNLTNTENNRKIKNSNVAIYQEECNFESTGKNHSLNINHNMDNDLETVKKKKKKKKNKKIIKDLWDETSCKDSGKLFDNYENNNLKNEPQFSNNDNINKRQLKSDSLIHPKKQKVASSEPLQKYNNYLSADRSYHFDELSFQSNTMYIGGNIVEIGKFQGFDVKKEDETRLKLLRKEMINKGIPRKEIENVLKGERRRAEKALAREKKIACFNCRKFGHNVSDCPELGGESEVGNICFKCGSTEHKYTDCRVVTEKDAFKFAECFICKEQGHIARQCPDNPRGLYPKGGACKICGSVTHLKKDCPQLVNEKEKSSITVGTVDGALLEALEEEVTHYPVEKIIHKNKKKKILF